MTRPSSPAFRATAYLAIALLGFALTVSAGSSGRPGPRLSRVNDLVDLIAREDGRARELRERLEDLNGRVHALQERSSGTEGRLSRLQETIDTLAPLAGLTPATGPGIVVELRDSTMKSSPTGDPNDLVIHEQDLQAVVNGVWQAGAEAVAVNGERVTSLSAVRCVGNTLLMHGTVHSPPYRVEAIGDPDTLLANLAADPLVERVRIVAQEFRLGYAVEAKDELALPGFRGILNARYASPLDT